MLETSTIEPCVPRPAHLLRGGAREQDRRLEVRGEGCVEGRPVELGRLDPGGIAGERHQAVELALHSTAASM